MRYKQKLMKMREKVINVDKKSKFRNLRVNNGQNSKQSLMKFKKGMKEINEIKAWRKKPKKTETNLVELLTL